MVPWFITLHLKEGVTTSLCCTEPDARKAFDTWKDAIEAAFEQQRTLIEIEGFDDSPERSRRELAVLAEDVLYVVIGKY